MAASMTSTASESPVYLVESDDGRCTTPLYISIVSGHQELDPQPCSSRECDDHEGSPDEAGEGGAWSRSEVLLLISLYEKYYADFNNRKLKKRTVWRKISVEMNEAGAHRSPDDCENKFKGLKRTYTRRRQDKRKTGRGRKDWEFYQHMDNLFQDTAEYTAPVCTSMPVVPAASVTESQVIIPASTGPSATTTALAIAMPSQAGTVYPQSAQTSRSTRQPELPQARRKRPAAILGEILERMDAWEQEDRQRYRQQLKLQRTKLRLLNRLVCQSKQSQQP
ncbi:uncharacterized protein LOC115327646 [Ixodes scapularis]|uniref:uncharacterized protein LOC115327646 n=1 Tax=Ixodes scapularis TaxID=6945 RepID=UPI001A9F1C94|nr:uncharacterized protein LOC115327646 [Ixodes scapularis]